MRNTIKRHIDFACAENDPSAKTPLFIARAKKAKFSDDARYGLIVTKKTFKLAVDRNRAKRLLREWLRQNQGLMSADMDYVFIARRSILEASLDHGIRTMANALRELSKK